MVITSADKDSTCPITFVLIKIQKNGRHQPKKEAAQRESNNQMFKRLQMQKVKCKALWRKRERWEAGCVLSLASGIDASEPGSRSILFSVKVIKVFRQKMMHDDTNIRVLLFCRSQLVRYQIGLGHVEGGEIVPGIFPVWQYPIVHLTSNVLK